MPRWGCVSWAQGDDGYDAISAAAREVPAGGWIVGAGYDQNRLAERRHPTAQELDAVALTHCVWLRHTSGHMAVVNGAVLAEIDIDAAEVPAGGQVERDGTGQATGLLLETAQSLLRGLVYPYSIDDIAMRWQIATHAIGDLAVTTALDCHEHALRDLPRADHRHRIEHFDRGIPLPGSSDRPVVQGARLPGIAAWCCAGRPGAPSPLLARPSRHCRRCTPGCSGRRTPAFEEHRMGSIVPGKLTDLAVLSDDLTAVDPEQIASLQVLATVVDGEVRHDVGLG